MPEGEARDVAGRRYALAIMAFLDDDESTADAWTEAVDALEALTSEGSYVAALQSDGMTDEQFQEIVRRVVPDIGEMQLNLLRLLRRKNRLALGPSIASYYRELLDERRGSRGRWCAPPSRSTTSAASASARSWRGARAAPWNWKPRSTRS